VKTYSIFYQLFAEFPSIFFELIGRSPILKTGMSVEQIAEQLHVDVEAVQQAAQQNT